MKFITAFAAAVTCQLALARFPSTPINELKKSVAKFSSSGALAKRDTDPSLLYPEYYLSVPVDHFHNESMYEPHSSDNFQLRYWFDDTYYKPGGPVFMLESGETDAASRLVYLQKGIVYEIAKATGGIGVIIEHRYYGKSFPTSDLSTENLRFLTTEQALADTAYFAQNVVFKGHESRNLTSATTPWIAYGGSYAGAFAAFLRTLYPGVFFGAISSSGVTEALWDYWQYYEPVRIYGPQQCIKYTQELTNVVDNIFKLNNTAATNYMKTTFGLEGIKYDTDFANAIAQGIAGWQGRNWDPEVNSPAFDEYCGNLTSPKLVSPESVKSEFSAVALLAAGGYGKQIPELIVPMLNYINYINNTVVQPCVAEAQTQDECYTTHNATYYQQTTIDQWPVRSWAYQYCHQFGYLQTGSGVPATQLPLISRSIDLPYESIICVDAFNYTAPPNITAINKYGGFDIAYSRLAIIGGEADPWRPVTPLAQQFSPFTNRPNNTDQPLVLISGGVHHWDENGLFPNQTIATLPPAPIVQAQSKEAEIVMAWLKDFKAAT